MLDIYYNGLHDNILDKNKEKDRNTASSFNRSLTSIDKNYSMSDDSDITITFNDIYKK
jgi:gamma-glutamylcysteine synthetase